MATDYISREAAIKEARNFYPSIDHYCTSVKAVSLQDLSAIPAADVEPIVHAHWIRHGGAEEVEWILISNYECSNCHEWFRDNRRRCGECGAKMDGKEKEDA